VRPSSIASAIRVSRSMVAQHMISPSPSIALADLVIEYFTADEALNRMIETDGEISALAARADRAEQALRIAVGLTGPAAAVERPARWWQFWRRR
jgi:hypothetical protein